MTSANRQLEGPSRIEPSLLEPVPRGIADLAAELSAAGAVLGASLPPMTATNLASLVRIMNSYYSNLIEGHDTRPRDIERAISGHLDEDEGRRNLQLEAVAHARVQSELDAMAEAGTLPDPASGDFIRWLHREFYRDAPDEMLRAHGVTGDFQMTPGQWRKEPEHDVAVGRHVPPSSDKVDEVMGYFEQRYRFAEMGKATRIVSMAAAHHRLNYIHPFPDGNGRVSRLMSHAMAHKAGIGAHGLWSISRGLARGLESRTEYKQMMDYADSPRKGDLDGRGNLSQSALVDFTEWFLKVCLDQITFMSDLFDFDRLAQRLRKHVEQSDTLKPEAARLLEEALVRGEFERGEASRVTGLPERTARRMLSDLVAEGLLSSASPKGPVSLRFPVGSLETLFPKLYPQT